MQAVWMGHAPRLGLVVSGQSGCAPRAAGVARPEAPRRSPAGAGGLIGGGGGIPFITPSVSLHAMPNHNPCAHTYNNLIAPPAPQIAGLCCFVVWLKK